MQTLRQEKFHIQSVVILFKNVCSVRHLFCTIFAPLYVAKVLKKHVGSSWYLALVFFMKNAHSYEIFTELLLQLLSEKSNLPKKIKIA